MAQGNRIVLVVSADRALRAQLCGILGDQSPAGHLAVDADPSHAAHMAEVLAPDVILVDAPRGVSESVMGRLREVTPGAKLLLFAAQWTAHAMRDALEQGAHGCLLKSAEAGEWQRAVRAVLSGDFWIERQTLADTVEHLVRRSPPPPGPLRAQLARLTGREREIVEAVMSGMTNKQIARQLSISAATVKTHLHHVFAKLGTSRRMLMTGFGPARSGDRPSLKLVRG